MQALLHFEAIQPLPKQVDINLLDSLVVKFIMPNSGSPNFANTIDQEELSSIFLEVHPYEKDVLEYVLKVLKFFFSIKIFLACMHSDLSGKDIFFVIPYPLVMGYKTCLMSLFLCTAV